MSETMMIDSHVFERMNIRLDSKEQNQVIEAIKNKWGRLQDNQASDFAIIAMNLNHLRKTDDSQWESNGEAVVGIVRKGTLLTVMLRRFNQPMTKEALRVDKVKWAIKPPLEAKRMGRRAKKWR